MGQRSPSRYELRPGSLHEGYSLFFSFKFAPGNRPGGCRRCPSRQRAQCLTPLAYCLHNKMVIRPVYFTPSMPFGTLSHTRLALRRRALCSTVSNTMPSIGKSLRQAYQIQDIAHDALQAVRAEMATEGGPLKVTKEAAEMISKLTRVWYQAQERISFHRRIAAPGRGPAVMKPPRRKAPAAAPTLASLGTKAPIVAPSVAPSAPAG